MIKRLLKLILSSIGFFTLFLLNIKNVYALPPGTDVRCDPSVLGPVVINTAIGCIPVNDQNAFIGFILTWAIGIGGGIALILIAFASFMIMTSTGNPDRLKAGQELLTSALSGLILLIFSIFVLRLIGVQILNIPGFGN